MRENSIKLARRPQIEIILPIYNEVRNLQPLIKLLDEVSDALKSEADCRYLFVNDGSSDGSSELLYRLHTERKDIRVVELVHNFGHSAAITCGIEHFDGDIAVLMDADLQDSPRAIIDMYRAWKRGVKTVVAERASRKEKTKILFGAFYFLLHKFSRTLPPINFGTFCLLDKSVVDRVKKITERNRYFPGLVAYSSGRIFPVPLERNARAAGSSRVGFLGLINLAITAFLSFSAVPIRLVSILGLVTSMAGFTVTGWVLWQKLFTTRAIPGWASTMSMVGTSAGVQLLCLGIIGEYIARIYEEVKNRPVYLVDRVLEHEKQTKASSPRSSASAI